MDGHVGTSNAHVFGPRGVGKTSLIEKVKSELTRERQGGEAKAAVAMTAVNSLHTIEEARKTLVHDIGVSFLESLRPEKWVADLKLVSVEWTKKEKIWSSVCEKLAEKCRERPVIFMVDEAHRMEHEVLAALLDDIEMIRQKGGPIVSVFAGKPLLMDVIAKAGVSYEERSEYLSLDLLDEKASAAAIEYPLAERSMKISEEALRLVVEDAQGYPTYLQFWGSELWHLGIEKADKNIISTEDVALARGEIEKRKDLAYQSRFSQWSKEDGRLIVSLTKRLLKSGDVNKLRLEEMVEEELGTQRRSPAETDRIFRQMIETDYVWSPMGTANYKSALPSYFNYILHQEKLKMAQRKAEDGAGYEH